MPFQGTFHRVLVVEIVIAAAVFAVVSSFLLVVLVRRRAGKDRPLGRDRHPLLEGTYAVVLVAVAALLSWMSIAANDREHTASRPALVVQVTGFQWCWRFTYPAAHFSVTGTCGPDGRPPTLVLPVGEPVRIDVTSSDVIHEFWVPALDYKTEAMPNHVNSFTITLSSTGRYAGKCSEFCGLYHAWMDFSVQGVAPAAFQRFERSHAVSA